MCYDTSSFIVSFLWQEDHGVGSTDHFSALKIWMFENKFVSLPSHLKTIEPMEVHRGAGTMCNTKTSKVISRTDPMILEGSGHYVTITDCLDPDVSIRTYLHRRSG